LPWARRKINHGEEGVAARAVARVGTSYGVVGIIQAIADAVRNDKIAHRHTALDVRLRE
jgi:hypothetical protein